MKILLVTFSDNADHQDTLIGMYEMLKGKEDVTLLAIKDPKVPIAVDKNTWLVDCPKRPGITKKTLDLPLLLSIIHKIKKKHFDVIYFESLHTWNLPIMLASGKAKIYHVIHEVIPHEDDSQQNMVNFMNKAICKLTNYIVLRNKIYIQPMIERYSFPLDRIKYLELWRRYPEYTSPCYTKTMLFFGRMNPYKGIDNLLAVAKACPEIHIKAVGQIDPQMENVVDELSHLPNVELNTGYVSDEEMRESFIKADWVILPYNSASQSGVIIDAYKYSRPVIAFDVGAISEQVSNGKSGYLVKPGDIMAFAEKIKYVSQMPTEDYEMFTEYAYKYGSEKYSVKWAVDRFLKIFD